VIIGEYGTFVVKKLITRNFKVFLYFSHYWMKLEATEVLVNSRITTEFPKKVDPKLVVGRVD